MDTNITETNELYIIPKRYRITENLHIVSGSSRTFAGVHWSNHSASP
jgi:hypothetical protein